MAGTSYLREHDVYEEWMKFVSDNEVESTKHTEVTATVYLAIREDDNKLVGIINIRHTLNDYLYNFGGHIGYSVRKAERKKGYAKEMLKFALEECSKMGMKKVLITCDSDNIASAKTIQSCGGVLENEIPEDGRVTQRYWIEFYQIMRINVK
jgi:predicted acetyltransferase